MLVSFDMKAILVKNGKEVIEILPISSLKFKAGYEPMKAKSI